MIRSFVHLVGLLGKLRCAVPSRCSVCFLALSHACVRGVGTTAGAADDCFATQLAPRLQRRCLNCHNDSERKGDFSLSGPAGLIDSGYVDTEHIDSSYLLELVTPENGTADMPKDAKPLSPAEIHEIAGVGGATRSTGLFTGPVAAAEDATIWEDLRWMQHGRFGVSLFDNHNARAALWRLDEPQGNATVSDSSGNGKESSDSSSSTEKKSDSAKSDTKKADSKKSDSATKATKD